MKPQTDTQNCLKPPNRQSIIDPLQSVIPDYPLISDEQHNSKSFGNEIYDVAPGEGRHPVSIMTGKYCEELAFPVLFPKGRFGYKAERKNKLTPVKYFNARLLHYSGRFATNPKRTNSVSKT